jgi:transposase-like protein
MSGGSSRRYPPELRERAVRMVAEISGQHGRSFMTGHNVWSQNGPQIGRECRLHISRRVVGDVAVPQARWAAA